MDAILPLKTEKQCRRCGETKSFDEFTKDIRRPDGHGHWCKRCKSLYDEGYKKRRKIDGNKRKRRAIKARDVHKEVIKLLGGKCTKCGFDDARALQVDHVNGGGVKEIRKIGQWNVYLGIYDRIMSGQVVRDYQVLCANCNWIKRHENRET